ncbi:MAG: cobalt-precorrin 5A hydrolase [Candidatus Methanoplasma sp.]|nr:cobalt-precorrin 5A hydrolase [Candidatus Methanoplasma sp.]
MKIRIIAFSRKGCELAQRVCQALENDECEVYSKTAADTAGAKKIEGPVSKWTEESFRVSDAIIFIGAAGIAVRHIAPFLKNKTTDPAVVSMDDGGRFALSLLSGHIGGANDLTEKIAKGIGAVPVITTATDVRGRFSADSFAAGHDMHMNSMSAAKKVSSLIVDDKKVGLASDIPISGGIPPELDLNGNEDVGIFISYGRSEGPFKTTLKLTPRCHILGIGCRRGASAESIEALVGDVLKRENISINSVRAAATIDLKCDEEGLLEFSEKIGAELLLFSPGELASLPDTGFTSSERVMSAVGVGNVCERAAVAASDNGEMIVKKTSRNGVTLAVVREPVYLDLMRK